MTKKYTAKPYSYLVIHTTLVSDNPLRFRNNLLERILKLIMTTDDKIRDEKYSINREAAKYQHYHLENLIKMIILQVKNCYLLVKED